MQLAGLGAASLFKTPKAFNNLMLDVIGKGICTKCGMCVSSCQVHALSMTEEGPRKVGPCRLCEACYHSCPRSPALSEELLKASLKYEGVEDEVLGRYINIISARTTREDVRSRAQDGGVVTTLLIYAFERGLIDGAIVASKSSVEAWRPIPKVALDVSAALEAAGTKYSSSPNLVALKDAVYGYELERLCVVGVPCQVTAAQNVRVHPKAARKIGDKIALIIGLFCMESFPHKRLVEYLALNKIDASRVSKFDIKDGKFRVYVEGSESLSVPVKDLKGYVNEYCEVCRDLTSLYADISVGAIGSQRGWSTVIVRSSKGAELFNNAVRDGYLEVGDIGSGTDTLKKIAKRKASKK
ncbi:MAG: Coenzyme F420 hydrogenase/dehydrogenase, beta subunit C-terminal domain [Candidatus Nezhaarchaeota archaeon]|nr:Coenzyme F420 hydrogenase/dehydrogenase, beta subunit C-terminal domain [Candidatus Nezhaarchaeota archaeon]MCX8142313.1 Coenzyme F420 hydrogenase/dehydrogenase, beta subunit C-terminal domain [Candidatus Nezhaarchaeota archaeon]MDW8050714.1 Coenzyme F420 hydrogenase/dehydrogenase, beta subunit C-terminal domain [Nitrososphaerota archaeon]